MSNNYNRKQDAENEGTQRGNSNQDNMRFEKQKREEDRNQKDDRNKQDHTKKSR